VFSRTDQLIIIALYITYTSWMSKWHGLSLNGIMLVIHISIRITESHKHRITNHVIERFGSGKSKLYKYFASW